MPDLIERARADLRLPLPDVASAPPREGLQLVGVEVWFWLTNRAPASATAAIPGLSATISATPVDLEIAVDHRIVHCADGGTTWDPWRPSSSQHSECVHVFEVRGEFTVRATTHWNMRWAASDGRSGQLPDVARTRTFPLYLHEAQATTD